MPFIGAQPATTFAKATSQVFTNANGNIVDFTLNKHVSNPEDIEVFVANIQQQPTTSYTILSDGVTLRFSEAPPSGDFYVVYRNLAQQTGTDTGAFRKTGGSISDTVAVTGNDSSYTQASGNATSTLSVINSSYTNSSNGVLYVKQGAGTNNPTMTLEQTGGGGNPNDTQGLHIKIAGQNQGSGKAIRVTTTNSSLNSGNAFDAFTVYNGGGLTIKNTSNVTTLDLTTDGYLTKPRHPYFAVRRGNNAGEQMVNASNSHTVAVPVTFDTEELDPFNMFNNSNYKISIPVSGVYAFHWSVLTGLLIPSSGVNWCSFNLMLNDSTASRIPGTPDMYEEVYNASGSANAGIGGSGRYFKKVTGSCQVYVSHTDTVRLMFYCSASTNARIHSGSHSTFCGYLLG
tara:strand:+ start:4401 stop:5600 length:1200 start_codon:yes stop_codon:yes gene_type:complete